VGRKIALHPQNRKKNKQWKKHFTSTTTTDGLKCTVTTAHKKNLVAWDKYRVIAKFMELLMQTVDQIEKGESISITVKK